TSEHATVLRITAVNSATIMTPSRNADKRLRPRRIAWFISSPQALPLTRAIEVPRDCSPKLFSFSSVFAIALAEHEEFQACFDEKRQHTDIINYCSLGKS